MRTVALIAFFGTLVVFVLGAIFGGCASAPPAVRMPSVAVLPSILPAPLEPTIEVPADSPRFKDLVLSAGEPSPYDGVLVSEETYARKMILDASTLKRVQAELAAWKALHTAQVKAFADAEKVYRDTVSRLYKAAQPSWWERYGFHVGVVAGVLGTVLIVHAVH